MIDERACANKVRRFRELMAERGYDAAILCNTPDLRWLTGAERTFDFEKAHTAYITQDRLCLHTDSRYFNTFRERLGSSSAWNIDMELIDAPEWIAKHAMETHARVIAIEDSVDLATYDALRVALARASLAALLPRMHNDISVRLRSVKDATEIKLLQQAQRITDEAFLHTVACMHAGMTELDVRIELESYMLSHGADALSFESIIAAGPHGANPHALPSDYVLQKGDMVVMDFGACYNDYHADMTRTVCVGKPTHEAREVYDIVRTTNETCAAAIAPGVIGRDIHQIAVDQITAAGYGEYFKHGLGHGVGIQIHENPNFNRRSDDVIPVGAVITDEPGIYLPGKFGVRIEDCGLVDEDGFHPFSTITHELLCVGQ